MDRNENAFIIVIGSCLTVTSQICHTVIIFKLLSYLNDTTYIDYRCIHYLDSLIFNLHFRMHLKISWVDAT